MKRLIEGFLHARHKAFTLIEMVIVLAIIALLMLIIVPNLNAQRQSATSKQAAAMTTVVHDQAVLYRTENELADTTPVTLDELEKAHYLTADQLKQASKLKISTDA